MDRTKRSKQPKKPIDPADLMSSFETLFGAFPAEEIAARAMAWQAADPIRITSTAAWERLTPEEVNMYRVRGDSLIRTLKRRAAGQDTA